MIWVRREAEAAATAAAAAAEEGRRLGTETEEEEKEKIPLLPFSSVMREAESVEPEKGGSFVRGGRRRHDRVARFAEIESFTVCLSYFY